MGVIFVSRIQAFAANGGRRVGERTGEEDSSRDPPQTVPSSSWSPQLIKIGIAPHSTCSIEG